MKLISLAVILSGVAFGQATLTVVQVGTDVPFPGNTLNFAVNLTGSANLNIAAIALSNWPGGINFALGQESKGIGKTLQCDPTAGNCLISGASATQATNQVFTDGQVLTFSYTIPTTSQIGSILGLSIPSPFFAADLNGNTIALTATGLNLTIVVNPNCLSNLASSIQTYLKTTPITQTGLDQIEQQILAISSGACK